MYHAVYSLRAEEPADVHVVCDNWNSMTVWWCVNTTDKWHLFWSERKYAGCVNLTHFISEIYAVFKSVPYGYVKYQRSF